MNNNELSEEQRNEIGVERLQHNVNQSCNFFPVKFLRRLFSDDFDCVGFEPLEHLKSSSSFTSSEEAAHCAMIAKSSISSFSSGSLADDAEISR